MKKKIRVVAAIIWDHKREKILLSRRKAEQDFAGLWEFPGGKVEMGEPDQAALIRELKEEIAIEATLFEEALSFQYHYPDKTIDFVIFEVFSFTGTPQGAESQEIAWIKQDQLSELQFPTANKMMIDYLQEKPDHKLE